MMCDTSRKGQFCFVVGFILTLALSAMTVQAATFVTVNGEAVIEAENYTRLSGSFPGPWFFSSTLPDYRGSGYMRSSTSETYTSTYSPQNGSVKYDIDFRQTGTYYIHLRSHADDHTQNGFFATIDGAQIDYGHPDAHYIYVEKHFNPRWYWYCDGGGTEHRGYIVSFNIQTKGVHTLGIHRRDRGSKLDRLWITQDVSGPQDVETLSLADPDNFIVTQDSEICGDGSDNNGNGLTDCDDPECVSYAGCFPEDDCSNGVDDDLDGLADCDDPDCGSYAGCLPESDCSDGVDDDLDGLTDCDDPDCGSYAGCLPESDCSNGVDDDLDGLTDCDDPDCGSYAACLPESDCSNGVDDDLDGLTDCDDNDCSERDSDNDTITDCLDVFPQNPDEWQDVDTDGMGDNADDDDDNDTVPDTEESGMNGDALNYDGNSDGSPDSNQNAVISLHSNSSVDYLTFSVSDQGIFTKVITSDTSTSLPLPDGTDLTYDLFSLDMSSIQNGANADLTVYLPAGDTIDDVFLFGPTPEDGQDHWYRFDYDDATGAQINGNVVTMHFVDGLRGDHDLVSNGTISTSIGLANLATIDDSDDDAVDTGSGGGGGGCFIRSFQ